MKKIKSGDSVMVITGKYKGKVAPVEKVIEDKVILKGINVVKRAMKGKGFVEKTLPIHISNVMYYSEKDQKPCKVAISIDKKGKKTRVCKKTGSAI